MRRIFYVLVVMLVAAALLAACGGGGASSQGGGSSGGAAPTSSAGTESATATTGGTPGGGAAAGNAQAGETLFAQAAIGTNPGCKTCHSLDGTKLVGPTMQGMGPRAETRVQGQSAEQYLHASIIDPNAFVVPEYAPGVMPSFRTVLDDQQVNDLVAYLLTLK